MKVHENIYFYRGDQIEHQRMYTGMAASNFVVIKGEHQVLIDSSILKGSQKVRIVDEMNSDGVRLENTKHILFTHFHPDHVVGCAPIIKNNNPNLWIPEACEKYLNSADFQLDAHINLPRLIRKEIFPYPRQVLKMLLYFFGYTFNHFIADELIQHGNEFEFNGIKIQAISTLGHCEGHMSYYLPEQKILICGDVFTISNHTGVSINNSTSNYEKALDDLRMILKLPIQTLITGHDDIIHGQTKIRKLIREVIKKTEALTNKILNLLDAPLTITDIEARVFGNRSLWLTMNNEFIIYNTLRYLLKKGLIYRERIGKYYYWAKKNG